MPPSAAARGGSCSTGNRRCVEALRLASLPLGPGSPQRTDRAVQRLRAFAHFPTGNCLPRTTSKSLYGVSASPPPTCVRWPGRPIMGRRSRSTRGRPSAISPFPTWAAPGPGSHVTDRSSDRDFQAHEATLPGERLSAPVRRDPRPCGARPGPQVPAAPAYAGDGPWRGWAHQRSDSVRHRPCNPGCGGALRAARSGICKRGDEAATSCRAENKASHALKGLLKAFNGWFS